MSRETSYFDQEFLGEMGDADYREGTAFVIMPFSDEFETIYLAIEEACKRINIESCKVNNIPGSGVVLRRIYKSIEEAEFIIVDLTNSRPNVYYELGYAHGVGNGEFDVLLIAKEGTKIEFDISPLNVHFYSSVEDLKNMVLKQLKEMKESL